MQEDSERWKDLAKMAANEQDPAKLFDIIRELNDLLEKKQRRLENLPKPDNSK